MPAAALPSDIVFTPSVKALQKARGSRHAYALHVIDGACAYPPDNWLSRGPDMPLAGFD